MSWSMPKTAGGSWRPREKRSGSSQPCSQSQAVLCLDRRCVTLLLSRCFPVFVSQHKLQSLRERQAATVLGEVEWSLMESILEKAKRPGGMQWQIEACHFGFPAPRHAAQPTAKSPQASSSHEEPRICVRTGPSQITSSRRMHTREIINCHFPSLQTLVSIDFSFIWSNRDN